LLKLRRGRKPPREMPTRSIVTRLSWGGLAQRQRPQLRLARCMSSIRPWTPQSDGLQRDKVTRHGTETKRPARSLLKKVSRSHCIYRSGVRGSGMIVSCRVPGGQAGSFRARRCWPGTWSRRPARAEQVAQVQRGGAALEPGVVPGGAAVAELEAASPPGGDLGDGAFDVGPVLHVVLAQP